MVESIIIALPFSLGHIHPMHHVYAGFSEHPNRRSFASHDQVFVVKFGYCQTLDGWDDRMNIGFAEAARKNVPKIIVSCPLAMCTDWRRVADVEAGEWEKGLKGIEKPLLAWADALFGPAAIMPVVRTEMEVEHPKRFGDARFRTNGVGELRYVPMQAIPGLVASMANFGINDPLAEEVVLRLGQFLRTELSKFAQSLNLPRRS